MGYDLNKKWRGSHFYSYWLIAGERRMREKKREERKLMEIEEDKKLILKGV